jgi:hypothetical protein
MRSVFYRYIRPVQFDSKRAELVTNPKGGVCLRFEMVGDALWFTHARCSSDEFFSKDVAKRCADVRATDAKKNGYVDLGYCGHIPFTKKTDELIHEIISWASMWVPQVKEASVLYHAFELKELATDLETIGYANQLQERLGVEWKSSMAAANYGEMYGKL